MSIDLRLLRHARALAEHGSFSRAAEALDIAQPTLSRGIQALEAHVGQPLFHRSRAGHEPTDFGRLFLQRAADVLAEADDLDREVALAQGRGTGELSVGLGPYAAEVLGPSCAARFADAHPGVRLRLLTNDPAALARSLRTRMLDLAIAEASVLEADDAFETVARLAPLDGYVVVRAGHPVAGRRTLELADLLDYPFAQVVMLPPRVLKPILAARLPASAHEGPSPAPFPAIECPTARFAVSVVSHSNAFTFASLGMVRQELEGGRLVALLEAPWIRVEWSVVRLRKRTMSPAMIAFADEVQQVHAEALRAEAPLRARWAASREGAGPAGSSSRASGAAGSGRGRSSERRS